MLFPVVGAVTAMWLLISPLVDFETGFRAALAISVGIAALALAPLGIWSPWARRAMVALGIVLAVVNFAHAPSIGPLASFATSAMALVVAGAAPTPVVAVAHAVPAGVPTTALLRRPVAVTEPYMAPLQTAA